MLQDILGTFFLVFTIVIIKCLKLIKKYLKNIVISKKVNK